MSTYFTLEENSYWDYKSWKELRFQILNSGEYLISKKYTLLDWFLGDIPSPPINLGKYLESEFAFEGNWPSYWAYEVSPPQMDSEDFRKILKYQESMHTLAVNYTLFSRINHFLYDSNKIDEKNWINFLNNEINLTEEKLTNKKLNTKVYRSEIDKSFFSAIMCIEIENFIYTSFNMHKYVMQGNISFEIDFIKNDGWRGFNDPFDLGKLFNTYVNILYLDYLRDGLDEETKKSIQIKENEEFDYREFLQNWLSDLDLPSYEEDFESLQNKQLQHLEHIEEEKERISQKASNYCVEDLTEGVDYTYLPEKERIKKIFESPGTVGPKRVAYFEYLYNEKWKEKTWAQTLEDGKELYERILGQQFPDIYENADNWHSARGALTDNKPENLHKIQDLKSKLKGN